MNEIKFVDVGEGITEGHIQKWLVKDGDEVKEDQPVAQIETDKAVVNIPSPTSGRIKINARENTDVKVGSTLAYIGNAEELSKVSGTAAENAPAPKERAEAAPVARPVAESGAARDILAAPSVRRLAEQLKVDLSAVTGTGPHGRILENDVRTTASASQPKPPYKKFSETLEEKHRDMIDRVQLSQTRKAISKNMEASWTIPRASHMDLIDATSLYGIVSKEAQRVMKEFGVKLSFLPFIIKATIEALKEYPSFNASYDHETSEVLLKRYYNIGLAAEAADGLKVIVLKDADKKSIVEIAKETDALHKKILDNTISIAEMQDSTFTITNVGSLGGGFLSVPMINYPDVAILAVHLIRDMPVVKDGAVAVGKVLPFTVTFDHRVVDGADAVKFGNALKGYLEDPEFLDMI